MKSIKKIITTLFCLLMIVSIITTTNLSASAAWHTITSNYITTIFKVHNAPLTGYQAPSDIGGISAGTANNRLFVVKSNSNENLATLYYYNNIYNTQFATEQKLPKRIFFPSGILGHANSMTVDDNNIYIAAWKKTVNDNQRFEIVRISRSAITSASDQEVVSVVSEPTTGDPNKRAGYVANGTVKICETYTVKYNDSTTYDEKIMAIAKYSYNSTTGVTKLIISHGKTSTSRRYTIATFQNNQFTVVKNSYFELSNPVDMSNATAQDIFYGGSSYGLYLLFWGYNATNQTGNKLTNYVVRYNISSVNGNGSGTSGTISPSKTITIQGDSSKYASYELESLAYINRDANHVMMSKPMFIFSSNNVGTSNTSGGNVDSIEKITYTSANAGVVDMYASI